MKDYKEFRLVKNLSSKMLIENGLRSYGFDYYVLEKYCRSNMIKIKIYIDINSGELTYDVIDVNTGSFYHQFYQGDVINNLVVKKLVEDLDKIINSLVQKKILYKRTAKNK